jgi:hypothetical protein
MSYGVPSFKWWRRGDLPSKIWLLSEFRVQLFKVALDRAGSMNELGRTLGYRSRTHPGWSIRQMLLGFQPIPYDKAELLSSLTETPMDLILENQTHRETITVDRTNRALREYGLLCYLLK